MRDRIRKRKKKIRLMLLLTLALTLSIIGFLHAKKQPDVIAKSEYDINLEKELDNVKSKAFEVWKQAKAMGKSEDKELEEFIVERLKSENVNIDSFYVTVQAGKVNVAMKNKAFLVEPGYYKANTNLNEMLDKWSQLVNKRYINIVDGRVGYLKSETKEMIDLILSTEVKEIKEKVFKDNIDVNLLYVPNSVEKISSDAFAGVSFKEIVFDANIDMIDSLFVNNELEKITFTNKIKTVKGQTFENAKIKEVNYLGAIEDLASTVYFTYYDAPNHNENCKLYIYGVPVQTIEVPEGVTLIREYTFMNYSNIEKIKLPSTLECMGPSAFVGSGVKEIIYNGTKEMWDKVQKAEEWFTNEMDCTVYCTDGEITYKRGI